MSRTGNLLFPPDEDVDWVTTIQKALPEKEADLDDVEIDDPVALEADAAFAEVAAETAERDAIDAAGWSARAVPPAAEAPLPPAARVALDSVVALEGGDEKTLRRIDDPVSREADAAFAETDAETALREAVETARWAPETVRRGDDPADDPVAAEADAAFAETGADAAERDAVEAARWAADTVRPDPDPPALTPEALAALDSVIVREGADGDLLTPVDDPVAARADAQFSLARADQAAEDAVAEVAWSAEAFKAAPETPAPPPDDAPSPADIDALDAAVARGADDSGFGELEDLVALGADTVFAEIAADVATRDAVRAAAARDAAREEETAAQEAAEAARRIAEADAPPPEPPMSAAELAAIDAEVFRGADLDDGLADDDPVALEADAAFAEVAADHAVAEAAFAAAWRPTTVPPGTMVAGRRPADAELGEIEDLVRAEAEIAFEDAAYDLALSAVDALVTGEAAALAAFDQAIASGADPEEALAAAIAAAEEVDPRAFGLARVATTTAADDFAGLAPTDEAAPEWEWIAQVERAPEPADEAPEPEITIAAVGRGFDDVPAALLAGGPGGDLLAVAAPGFRFFLDPALVLLPGVGRGPEERDDLILLDSVTERTPIPGTAAADLLLGGDGNDAIGGREGDDFIYGERPTDFDDAVHNVGNPLTDPTFAATGGDDAISGGAGSDTIWGGPGADQIHGDVPASGSALADQLPFSLGADGAGDDEIHGGDGADTIEGGGGADVLYGDAGDDNIFGYAGDDVLIGGEGTDALEGGAGADEFRFEGGTGADALARAGSLGTDRIGDYSDTDGDTFGLSDADFGLGAAGTLTDGADYFETALQALSAAPVDASGGNAGPAIVVMGSGAGSDGVEVYYTEDASAMTNANSYQVADVAGANLSQIGDADFNLRA